MITENLDFGILDGEQREIFFEDANGKKQSLGLAYVDKVTDGYNIALVGEDNEGNTSLVGTQGDIVTMKTISKLVDGNRFVSGMYIRPECIQVFSNNPNFRGLVFDGDFGVETVVNITDNE